MLYRNGFRQLRFEDLAQVQRTNSERQRARRVVNQRFLTAMLEMGIPLEKAELALSETGNVGIEVRDPPQAWTRTSVSQCICSCCTAR